MYLEDLHLRQSMSSLILFPYLQWVIDCMAITNLAQVEQRCKCPRLIKYNDAIVSTRGLWGKK